MSLSDKTDEEIMELLAEYGIKHGPIVDSTRKLYEKKLEKAMAEAPVNTSSDKTYYREEEEEITYITYRSPVRSEGSGDMLKQRKVTEPAEEQDDDSDEELVEYAETPILSQTTTTVNHSGARSQKPVKRAGGCVWRMFRLLLVLALLAGVSYYVCCRVLSSEGNAGAE